MIKLTEALGSRFPQTSDWATAALGALAGGLQDDTAVRDVSLGWTSLAMPGSPARVETLFMLTADRLGFVQAAGGPELPFWLSLAAIDNLDALGTSVPPANPSGAIVGDLQTVEVTVGGSLAMQVGWNVAFIGEVVEALIAVAEAPAEAPIEEAMPAELANHASVEAHTSQLDVIPPSNWVEQAVPPSEVAEPEAWLDIDGIDDAMPISPSSFILPEERLRIEAAIEAAFDPAIERPALAAGPVPDSEPWLEAGVVWSEPVDDIAYLGGHPAHPRKRKNGTMSFSAAGIEIAGRGVRSWTMNIDWAVVAGIELQGADELMFTDNLRIHTSGSALSLRMVDGTRMFFEVRDRRPPSVRGSLTSVLQLMSDITAYRSAH